MSNDGNDNSLAMTVEEAAQTLGSSRISAYHAVLADELPYIRIVRRILIPRLALEQMLERSGDPKED
jgi:excisionase family DNA binding protein